MNVAINAILENKMADDKTPVVVPVKGNSNTITSIISILTLITGILGGLALKPDKEVPVPVPVPAVDPIPSVDPKPKPDPKVDPVVDPTPSPKPAPKPDPVPDPAPQPSPAPNPNPAPSPQPNPSPQPTPPGPITPPATELPVAAVSISDSHGLPIGSIVAPGTQLIVSSDKSIHGKDPLSMIWIVTPELQTFMTPDKSTMVITTPNVSSETVITITQIVALGDRCAYKIVEIRCGHGALPPPDPKPDPKPNPDPNPPTPEPVATNLFLSVVEDTQHRTEPYIPILNAVGAWNSFRETGDDWRFFDIHTGEKRGRKAVADAIKASLPPPYSDPSNATAFAADVERLRTSGKLPLLVVQDLSSQSPVATLPLPKNVIDLKAARDKYKAAK